MVLPDSTFFVLRSQSAKRKKKRYKVPRFLSPTKGCRRLKWHFERDRITRLNLRKNNGCDYPRIARSGGALGACDRRNHVDRQLAAVQLARPQPAPTR